MTPLETSTTTRNFFTEGCAPPRSLAANRLPIALAAAAAVGGGAWLGWDWLAAVGVAPILLAVAPCLLMCGAGLCMGKMFGGRR